MNAEPLTPELKKKVQSLLDEGLKYTIRPKRARRRRPGCWIAKISRSDGDAYGQGVGATPSDAVKQCLEAWKRVPDSPTGKVTVGDGPQGEEPHE